MLRALVIDQLARDLIVKVKAFAENHPYVVGSSQVPGDISAQVVQFGDFRVVFSITHMGHVVARHMSVSVPGDAFPSPNAVFLLAHEFGFTGWDSAEPGQPGTDWQVGPHADERSIVVAQEIGTKH